MLLLSIFLACGFIGALASPQRALDLLAGGRIVNGTNAKPCAYPFVCSLQYFGSHSCGCSIVNECYVVTAAHCVDGDRPSSLSVLVDTIYLREEGTRYQVEEIKIHENYAPSKMYFADIAVLKLTNKINFTTCVQPVKFPEQLEETPGGTPARLIGWGYPYSGGSVMDILQQVDIQIYRDEDCRRIHYPNTVHNSSICAGVPGGGKGQCSGDSGGPLLANGHQVGIVSWSVKPCTIAPYPGVFTEVAYYVDWIKQNTKCPYS